MTESNNQLLRIDDDLGNSSTYSTFKMCAAIEGVQTGITNKVSAKAWIRTLESDYESFIAIIIDWNLESSHWSEVVERLIENKPLSKKVIISSWDRQFHEEFREYYTHLPKGLKNCWEQIVERIKALISK